MDKQTRNLPPVFYEKPEDDPTSHVYYQVHKGWNGGLDGSISQGINNYIFGNPWNNHIQTQENMISGYNIGKYVTKKC